MSDGTQAKPTSLAKVFWNCGGKRLLWITGIAACLFGATFAVTGGQAEELAEGSVQTIATITKAENYTGSGNSIDPDDYVRKANITFTFTAANGEIVKGTKNLPNIDRDRAVGETFPVWYAAASPENYELAVGHKERNTSALHWIAGVFASLAIAVAALMPWSEARALIAVRDSGMRLSATVIEPTRNQINHHDLGEHLHWKYEGMEPDHSRFPVPAIARPTVGETITIYQGRSSAVWEGEFGPALRLKRR